MAFAQVASEMKSRRAKAPYSKPEKTSFELFEADPNFRDRNKNSQNVRKYFFLSLAKIFLEIKLQNCEFSLSLSLGRVTMNCDKQLATLSMWSDLCCNSTDYKRRRMSVCVCVSGRLREAERERERERRETWTGKRSSAQTLRQT